MRIGLGAFFIAVALVLVAADPPNTAKLVPPDDPADVTTVRELCHGDIDLDSNGNVTGIGVSGADLGRFAQYGPALSRLGHVRSLGAHDAADQVRGSCGAGRRLRAPTWAT